MLGGCIAIGARGGLPGSSTLDCWTGGSRDVMLLCPWNKSESQEQTAKMVTLPQIPDQCNIQCVFH